MLIGVAGISGSHKTGLTRYLKSAFGFKRIHAGKPVKDAARKGFGLPKALVSGKAKDMPTDRLGGEEPRALMEAMSSAVAVKAPKAIPAIMERRIGKRMDKGHSVVVDGVRTAEQAKTITDLGGLMVRADAGKEPDPWKPSDATAASIKVDYTIDTSGKKAKRKAAADKMLQDMRS